MKTLTIKDLSREQELDAGSMASVRGGHNMGSQYTMPSYSFTPPTYPGPASIDSSLHATQDLKQAQQVFNDTANGSAFLSGVDVTNKTKQFGQNNISFG
jgi:hypothetical protein